jgi:hypothetical protein
LKTTTFVLAAIAILSAGAAAQAAPTPAPAPQPNRMAAVRDSTGEIVSQPARDVGVSRREIPAPLQKAVQDPYSLKGLKSCPKLAGAIVDLNGVLGPDYKAGDAYQENRMAKLAEAGGRTVVNSILPFRSILREVSGAAPADRRLRAASNAGFARRGFLRGVFQARGCKAQL